MNHLSLYENFSKPYYEFNMPEFYNAFRAVFNKEKEIEDKRCLDYGLTTPDGLLLPHYSDGIFKLLNISIPNWKHIVVSSIIEEVIKLILIDKEVEFFDNYRDDNEIEFGRVKNLKCNPIVFSGELDTFIFKIMLYDSNDWIEQVDYSHPVKVYGKKTEIEKYIEMISDTNKYNL